MKSTKVGNTLNNGFVKTKFKRMNRKKKSTITTNKDSHEELPMFSIFENIKQKICSLISFEDLFNRITKDEDLKRDTELIRSYIDSDDKVKADKHKKDLPAITVSGQYNNGHSISDLIKYIPYVCIDIDKVSDVSELFDKVVKIPEVIMAFISPSGNGVKAILQVDSSELDHKECYNQVAEYVSEIINHPVDRSCSDITRLCFLCHDSDCFYNENADVFNFNHSAVEIIADSNVTAQIKADPDYQELVKFTEKKIKFEEGFRNKFIYLLASNGNRYGIDQEELLEFVLNTYEQKDFDEEEITNTVNSAYSILDDHCKFKKKSELNGASNIFEVLQAVEALPKIPYIWHGISKGSFGCFYGPAKSFKSTLVDNFCMAMAAGEESFLDKKVHGGPYRVLSISLEEVFTLRANRLREQSKAFDRVTLGSNFLINKDELPSVIASNEDWNDLEQLIRKSKVEIVAIDSLSRFQFGKAGIEDSNCAKQILNRLIALKNKLGITLILIHHAPKGSAEKELSIDKLAGSYVLAQEFEFIYGINKTVNNQRYFKVMATRYIDEGEGKVIPIDVNKNRNIIFEDSVPESDYIDGRIDNTNLDLILDFIVEHNKVSTGELEKQFVISKMMSKKTLHSRLEKLVRTGKIEKPTRGFYKLINKAA
jgi:hypothetical protein